MLGPHVTIGIRSKEGQIKKIVRVTKYIVKGRCGWYKTKFFRQVFHKKTHDENTFKKRESEGDIDSQ